MSEVAFELLPEDRSRLNNLRWRAAGHAMHLMFWLMPRGDARDRLGDFIRMWLAECREQWALRYSIHVAPTDGGGDGR